MSRFWSEQVSTLSPYVPGEQPKSVHKLIKLNTNENPFGPSPKAVAAMQAQLNDDLRLYPDPNSTALKQRVAQHFALTESEVFVGNGSDEVLAHAFQALLKQDKPLLFPDISYSFYPVYCGLYNVAYENIALDANYAINPADYQKPCGGVIFPNPNAPTGRLLPLEAIEQILKQNPDVVVLVDEAYIDFGGESAASLVPHYENLLVVQTVSKSRSLAGLRVGFALGQSHLIEALERVKNSFNSYPIDRVAEAGAVAAIADDAYFKKCCQQVIDNRELVTKGMQTLGFNVLPSAANFVFASHNKLPAADIFQYLREQHIIVRYFNKPRLDNFLRISIGNQEECQALLAALTALVEGA